MANSLIQCTGTAQTTTATVTYNHLAGELIADTIEADTQVITRLGGVASQLYVEVSNNSNTVAATMTTRKGAGAGAQTATLTALTAGIFEDTTHSDTITAGDKWNYKTTPGSANILIITVIQMTFAATTNTLTPLVANGPSPTYVASTTYFTMLSGDYLTAVTSETNMKTRVMKAGTFKNMYINVITASASTVHTGHFNDNAVNAGSIAVSCTAATTGFFEDTTHTATITTGHDYDYQFITGATITSLVVGSIGIEYESTAGCSLLVAASDLAIIYAKTTTNYNAIGGGLITGTTTESFKQSYARDASLTLDNLGIFITANGTTLGGSVTLDKNAVASALTISFTTATGLVQDTTHSVTGFVAGDKLSTKIINADTAGGTHNISLEWIDMHGTTTAGVTIAQTVFVEWEEA